MEQELGPPERQVGNGESYWRCPQCLRSGRFHTLPLHPQHKHRAYCHPCQKCFDAGDLVRVIYPGERWPQHRARIAAHEAEYAGLQRAEAENAKEKKGGSPAPFPSPADRGGRRWVADVRHLNASEITEQEDSVEADAALAELIAGFPGGEGEYPSHAALRVALSHAEQALGLCAKHGLHPLALARLCHQEIWRRGMDAEHLAECADPDCVWRVCCAARGLPPLTWEELEESRRAGLEERQRRLDKRNEVVQRAAKLKAWNREARMKLGKR